jgi:hypothetical protein
VVHDYLYSVQFDRKEADAIFLDLMGRCGTPAWQRYSMYGAVRLFGGWYKAVILAVLLSVFLAGCRLAYVNSPTVYIPEDARDCRVEVRIYNHEKQSVVQTKEVPIEIGKGATVPIGVTP